MGFIYGKGPPERKAGVKVRPSNLTPEGLVDRGGCELGAPGRGKEPPAGTSPANTLVWVPVSLISDT